MRELEIRRGWLESTISRWIQEAQLHNKARENLQNLAYRRRKRNNMVDYHSEYDRISSNQQVSRRNGRRNEKERIGTLRADWERVGNTVPGTISALNSDRIK